MEEVFKSLKVGGGGGKMIFLILEIMNRRKK